MTNIVSVLIVSRDRPRLVNALWERAMSPSRRIEGGDTFVAGAQKAMISAMLVNVVSRDRSRLVNACGEGALFRHLNIE